MLWPEWDARPVEVRLHLRQLRPGGGQVETATPFGATNFAPGLTEARAKNPTAIIINLYGWDLVHALKAYAKLEVANGKIGVSGMVSGEQIGQPLGYADNAEIWGLIWDPKINTVSSGRFPQPTQTHSSQA